MQLFKRRNNNLTKTVITISSEFAQKESAQINW